MFKHILVPLDGSQLAEAALPPAAGLAEKLSASVTLIHVIEKNAPQEVHGERHLTDQDEALRYLEEQRVQAFPSSVEVSCHVHSEEVRNVARSIVAHSTEFQPDLILMCAHGRGGIRDLVVGSIAQQVIGLGEIPVLLIQPAGETSSPSAFRRFLVALDANPEHERSLEVAGELGLAVGAELHLVNVVQTPETLKAEQAAAGRLLPSATAAMLNMTEEYALRYLEERAASWRQRELAVTSEVRRGEPAQQLIKAAELAEDDLMVLGTHGKAGMGAFWAGSVASRIIGLTAIPLLLVPVRPDARVRAESGDRTSV